MSTQEPRAVSDRKDVKLYVIYDHPRDYPEGFVVREWLVSAKQTQAGDARFASSLEDARASLPAGVELIDDSDPDSAIAEVWA